MRGEDRRQRRLLVFCLRQHLEVADGLTKGLLASPGFARKRSNTPTPLVCVSQDRGPGLIL